MHDQVPHSLIALAPSGAKISVSARTSAEVELIAEVLHEARPNWKMRIDDRRLVFSREGKIVDLSPRKSAGVGHRR